MMIYRFYDADMTGHEERDVAGEAYSKLLQLCFRYSTTVSILLAPSFPEQLEVWEAFRIPVTPNVREVYSHYGFDTLCDSDRFRGYEIRHYLLTPQIQTLIGMRTGSIFQWICAWGHQNPEDISFFREDGSVFFTSTIHEGHCTFCPREDEDISAILNPYWYHIDRHWSWEYDVEDKM